MQSLIHHGIACILAAGVFTGYGLIDKNTSANSNQQTKAQLDLPAIAIEHRNPVSVTLEASQSNKGLLLNLFQEDSSSPINISVPMEWEYQEVRGTTIDKLQFEDPQFGFIRFRLLPDSSVSFATKYFPEKLLIHHPSPIPLKVKLIMVNLETEKTMRDVLLIKKPIVTLWDFTET